MDRSMALYNFQENKTNYIQDKNREKEVRVKKDKHLKVYRKKGNRSNSLFKKLKL
jgi:hypothetical protein